MAEVRAEAPALGNSLATRESGSDSRPAERDLPTSVFLAEELAFKAIEAEFGVRVLRQVGGQDVGYDGAFLLGDRQVAVEVKYTRSDNWSRFGSQAETLAATLSLKQRVPAYILLAIVTDQLSGPARQNAQQALERQLGQSGYPIKLRVYDMTGLMKQIGLR